MIDHERPHQPVLDQSERAPFPLLGSVLSDSVTSRAPHASHGRVAFSGGVVFLSLLLFRILRFGTIRRPRVPLLRPTLRCALLAAQPGSQVLNLQFSIFESISASAVPGIPNLYKETATLSPSGQYFLLSASGTHYLGVTWIEAR